MPHLPHPAHSVPANTAKPYPTITNQSNARNKNRQLLNTLSSLPQAVRVLRCSDVEHVVQFNIADGDILAWSGSNKRFINKTLTAIDPNLATVPQVREVFVAAGGNSGNAGNASDAALANIQQGLKQLSNYAIAYELLQVWVSGDVNFDLSDVAFPCARIRESGTIGQNKRGLSIRGIKSTTSAVALNVDDAPRTMTSQLIDGTATHTQNNISEVSALSNSGQGMQTWNIGVTPVTVGTQFLKGVTQTFIFPIATDRHITANTRIYFGRQQGSPSLTQTFQEMLTPCKITCTDTANKSVGFQVEGNVEFTEIHLELIDGIATPIHINGEFQILYCEFSNISAGGTGATLELSATGWGNDPNASSQLNSASAVVPGAINIRVQKSIFRDLNLSIDSGCDFVDCVFIHCKFINPVNAIFTNCTFYNCRSNELGRATHPHRLNNSMSITDSLMIYGATAEAYFQTWYNASLQLSTVIAQPMQSGGGNQAQEYITLNGNSRCTINDFSIPVSMGINEGGNGTDGLGAILVRAKNSYVNTRGLKIVAGSNANSFVSATNNSDVIFGKLDGATHNDTSACTNAAPLLTTDSSNVYLDQFIAKLPSGYNHISSETSGVLRFINSNVKVSSDFWLTLDASTAIKNVIYMNNSTMTNSVSDYIRENHFNITTKVDEHLFSLNNSKLLINTGPSPSGTGQGNIQPGQKRIDGMVKVDNYSSFIINGWEAGTYSAAENVVWNMNKGTGDPIFTVDNHSEISLRAVSATPYAVSSGNVSTVAKVENYSSFNATDCLLTVKGLTGIIALTVDNGSKCNLINTPVDIKAADNVSAILVSKNSSLNVTNPVAGTPTAVILGASLGIQITGNSSGFFQDIAVTAATSPNAIAAMNGSSLYMSGDRWHTTDCSE